MTKIIGLTGGIGSGKSTIAKLFKDEGIPVYIADDASKKLLDLPETIASIVVEFGDSIVSNEKIDRKKLAHIIFNNPEKLKKLNAIMHPLVKKHFDQWLLKNHNAPFVVKEAAILFESGSYKFCDAIITVVAPENIRIERVIKRDKVSEIEVQNRINNQWTDSQRVEKSDFIIENIDFEVAKQQFKKILKNLKNLQ